MNFIQSLMERLRILVGFKNWDYCVLWNLSDDQRFLEWLYCCCAGTDQANRGEEEPFFPVSCNLPCRDTMFEHPRSKACDLLAQLPLSTPLDAGDYTETLLSNKAKWMNFSRNCNLNMLEEIVGTRVLVPLPLGLLELYATKQIPEDQQVVDFILAQCRATLEQQPMMNSGPSHDRNNEIFPPNLFPTEEGNNQRDCIDPFHPVVSPAHPEANIDLPYHIPADCIHDLNSHSANFLQQFSYTTENGSKTDDLAANGKDPFKTSMDDGINMSVDMNAQTMDSSVGNKLDELGIEDESFKQENGRSNSMSDSDANEDDDDCRYRRRNANGKGHQSKNLVAERKRRKKLNDRLYTLRSLVPKISKLDRASILGDAISYVKELKAQVEDLQKELDDHSDGEGEERNTAASNNPTNADCLLNNGISHASKVDTEKSTLGSNINQENRESENSGEKVQQMEPQVEVAQLDGNEFFVKVFCEHKAGGFVRLMEALNCLGLEVTNVNATRHTCLVSNIFKVEKRDSEMVQADHVRDSLLELTRSSPKVWSQRSRSASENANAERHDHHLHHHHHHPQQHHHSCKRQFEPHHHFHRL